MKKILLSVFAVAALASCVQNEVVNPQTPISFGDAYVENSTKAIFEGANEVQAFQVWGTITGVDNNPVALYNGANVIRGGKNYNEAWSCDVTRFWTPSCTYAFYAVAHGTVTATNGVPTSIAYEVSEGEPIDLLYGEREDLIAHLV